MKKEQIFELMNGLPPDLVEEADVRPPAGGRRPRGIRGGLIAACLCLALVGTAFAAAAGAKALFRARLEPHMDGSGTFDGYTVSGNARTYRLKDFSEAFHEAGKTRDGRVDVEFSTIDEVRAYLGENIPCAWPEGWDGEFVVSLFHNEEGQIWGGEVISWDPGGTIDLRMRVLTEKYHQGRDGEKILGMYGGLGEKKRLDPYEMPNGALAEAYTEAGPDGCACTGFFLIDGYFYEIHTYDVPDRQSELWPRIQAVLDSFG